MVDLGVDHGVDFGVDFGVDHYVDLGVDLGVELGVTSFWFAAIIYSTSMLLPLLLVKYKPGVSSCFWTGADANSQHVVAHHCSWWNAVIVVQPQCC